jgi:hypothetical protein
MKLDEFCYVTFIIFSHRITDILTTDVYIYFLDLFQIMMNMKIHTL